ncbi:MAG TPA: carboxypeptidase-like regulatory domain-containing protein, partial [Candidatus Limnocylindria bacterium]|nr:carboxypeptidase-like regulatory domain-containing protein [Candidatus Limnocylindria bacterium]
MARSLVLALLVMVGASTPAAAAFASFAGHVTDAVTGAPLNRVCVWLGPVHLDPSRADTNCTFTDATGFYHIDNLPTGLSWPLTFHLAPDYKDFNSRDIPADAPIVLDVRLQPNVLCDPASTATPSTTVYLPNVTKTLGGPTGFQTPFIVQNTGSASTNLEVSFYRFSNGLC